MNELIQRPRRPRRARGMDACREVISRIAPKQYQITEDESAELINSVIAVFREACGSIALPTRKITAITTKFRDAGRRSAPWRAFSGRIAGRPQDGSDGNRINRWLMPTDHKFYAAQPVATLVEVKYFLQALSLDGAPDTEVSEALDLFYPWLIEHEVRPGKYLDPIQLIPVSFAVFLEEPRTLQSGHLIPLDRDGTHHPSNTFLMLARSNQLQGNLKVAELLELMAQIVEKHHQLAAQGDLLESRIQEK